MSFAGLTLSNATAPVSLAVTSPGLTGTTTNPVNLVTAAQIAVCRRQPERQRGCGHRHVPDRALGRATRALSVNVATSGGTAVAGVNYTPINQTVTFAAGQDSRDRHDPDQERRRPLLESDRQRRLEQPGRRGRSGKLRRPPRSPSSTSVRARSAAPVTMDLIQVIKKKHQVKEIILGFSGGLNATEAASIAEYALIQAGKKGSFTAKNAKAIKLLSAVYNPANDTVTLTPKKKFVLSKTAQLVVNGVPPSGLEDSLRPPDRRQRRRASRQQRGCH